jgi:hypothetical protein
MHSSQKAKHKTYTISCRATAGHHDFYRLRKCKKDTLLVILLTARGGTEQLKNKGQVPAGWL